MNIAEIEFQLKELVEQPFNAETFVFRFLEIYDAAKATVAKLKQGSGNLAKAPGDVLWKSKLFFRVAKPGQAAKTVDALASDPLTAKHKPRLLLATDGVEVYARDLKADQTTDIAFKKLNDAFDFFLPLANIERYEGVAENPADIKATGRLAKLYDEILKTNPDWISRDHTHELNLFMTRMLFCFFAEATSIFDKGLFTATLIRLTQDDGSDTPAVLDTLFSAMNAPQDARKNLPEYARRFPYVNGGLFREKTPLPKFSKRARRLLKECGDLNWSEINPDIFGSMIQAVVEPAMRGDMGMHYTSVPNIMKVLHPLFLLSLEEDFENARDSEPKLKKLLDRIYHIRVFDPACGSGNFLIIAYREMRKLETRIFLRLKEIAKQWSLPMTSVHLHQFYGIELADFACETAKLSLWIAEYQMNEQFKSIFGSAPPALPLRDSGNIVHDNACSLDWMAVCPKAGGVEIYLASNPPYVWSSDQTPAQKADLDSTFAGNVASYKTLDYVSIWVLKSAIYTEKTGAKAGLVTTNSICQGEQVAMLWPSVFFLNVEIFYAYTSFKWSNSAVRNAGVSCVIVGLRKRSNEKKAIFYGAHSKTVKKIGPYLIEMDEICVDKEADPINKLPKIYKGNQPTDGGNLILQPNEANDLLINAPDSRKFIKRLYGSDEFINGIERYCLWIDDADVVEAKKIKEIRRRIAEVAKSRSSSPKAATRSFAKYPHKFTEIRRFYGDILVIPCVSSENREVLPVGIVSDDSIITNRNFGVYDPPLWLMSIIASRMHYVWADITSGKLETRFNYSNTLTYNTFPMPDMSQAHLNELEGHTLDLLSAREAHPGKTIAWLYSPENMPANLLKAHRDLDDALERIYIGRPFKNDTERLEHLFKLYAVMLKREASTKSQHAKDDLPSRKKKEKV